MLRKEYLETSKNNDAGFILTIDSQSWMYGETCVVNLITSNGSTVIDTQRIVLPNTVSYSIYPQIQQAWGGYIQVQNKTTSNAVILSYETNDIAKAYDIMPQIGGTRINLGSSAIVPPSITDQIEVSIYLDIN